MRFALLSALALAACDGVPGLQDKAGLTARGAVPSAPSCAACHPYPLDDINHYYHLALQGNSFVAGAEHPNTCLDCHFGALLHFSYAGGGTARYRPLPAGRKADTARGAGLAAEVDSLIRAYADRNERVPWRTGPAHLNGTVDIALSPEVATDSLRGYAPADLSCSAVACHKTPGARYRWRSPGFTDCPSRDGRDPTCGEVPGKSGPP